MIKKSVQKKGSRDFSFTLSKRIRQQKGNVNSKLRKMNLEPQNKEISIKKVKEGYKKGDLEEYLKQYSQEQLEEQMLKCQEKYFNGEQIIEDEVYDQIIDYMKKNHKNSYILKKIGHEPKKDKVKLPYHMGSLDKLKTEKEIKNWLKRHNEPDQYNISDKLDGMSCMYHNGKLMSRGGDGDIGQDITKIIEYIQGVPREEKEISVRGEIIIKKREFENELKKNKQFKNPRNTIVGIVNSKKVNENHAKYLTFVGYQLYTGGELDIKQQLKKIKEKGFNVVKNEIVRSTKINKEDLSKILQERRKESEIEIDGIVINHNKFYNINREKNPKNMFAFKEQDMSQIKQTKVEDIEWNVSKDSLLIPTLVVEKVELQNTNVQRITGFNAEYVNKIECGIGSIIEIYKAGDIIPNIGRVIKSSKKGLLPRGENEEWVWPEGEKNIKLKNPEENKEYRLKQIKNFFQVLKIDQIGPSTIKTLFEKGYDTLPKIVNIQKEQLMGIEGMKEKKSQKIYENLQKRFEKGLKLEEIVVASNQLGQGFSKETVQKIIEQNPDLLNKNINQLNNINIDGKKTKEKFIKNWGNVLDFIKKNEFNKLKIQ